MYNNHPSLNHHTLPNKHSHWHKPPKKHLYFINHEIRSHFVRVVDEDGQTRILRREDALEEAKAKGVDLIEIVPAKPGPSGWIPSVCKMEKIGKFLYKKEKETPKAKKVREKEIRLHYNIADHDLDIKLKAAEKFLLERNSVLFRLTLRGREKMHKEIGEELLKKIQTKLSPLGQTITNTQNNGILLLRITPQKNLKSQNNHQHTQQQT